MSYKEKINNILDEIEINNSKFTLIIKKNLIRINEPSWTPSFKNIEGFYEFNLRNHIQRSFNKESKKYVINKEKTITYLVEGVLSNLRHIFTRCSPAKKPPRTKAYKDFFETLRKNRNNEAFINSIFDISEYFYTITKSGSISHVDNDVHRKNIYQLLCLMGKKYGKESMPIL